MLDDPKSVLIILGPTAVGKSLAAVCVAEALGGEIISADSRQVYRGMDIATDKPSPEILARVPHHLINILGSHEVFSAGQYRERAFGMIRQVRDRGRVPVVVGGTGFYIRALLRGLWQGPRADWELRARLLKEEARQGPGTLYRWLVDVDPEVSTRIHPRDMPKTIRALEVSLLTGIPLSEHHRLPLQPSPFRMGLFGLRRRREDLYRRIDQRVDTMMRRGLVREVRCLIQTGCQPGMPAMRGLGTRQIAEYLQESCSLPEAVRLIKRDTRRYAKRQMTWFRKEVGIHWIDLEVEEGAEDAAAKLLARIRSVTAARELSTSGAPRAVQSSQEATGSAPAPVPAKDGPGGEIC